MNYTVEYFHKRVKAEIEGRPVGILEYALAREILAARARVGLSQEAVAERMGTTKSAVSRLEAVGKHAPSLTTLKKYARAVGCHLEIRLVPEKSNQ
ncbi:helix-turn-helix domain-containing protein [Geomonas sp. RF6]|uniref:helix-turn-helix transcriptional regulator n=1 Tax=Geomonas sp. RF6 TaxID=2897342 RepID=UPI001E56AD89|nr:helix-turn-helix transcriptional regulator [Geomonas sp. RF6]UFS71756.1 helix-turn-helix domain-containing protein [Geomonas sp. RF6]